MIEHWEQVPIYGDRIKQRVREGEELGEKRGTINTLKQDIMEALELRFGLANGKVASYVDKINEPEKLRKLFRLIIKAKTLNQVKKTLNIP